MDLGGNDLTLPYDATCPVKARKPLLLTCDGTATIYLGRKDSSFPPEVLAWKEARWLRDQLTLLLLHVYPEDYQGNMPCPLCHPQ